MAHEYTIKKCPAGWFVLMDGQALASFSRKREAVAAVEAYTARNSQRPAQTIGELRGMPHGDGDWGRIPTIGEIRGWGAIEDW